MTKKESDRLYLNVDEMVDLVAWSYQEGYTTAMKILQQTSTTVITDNLKERMRDKIKLMMANDVRKSESNPKE